MIDGAFRSIRRWEWGSAHAGPCLIAAVLINNDQTGRTFGACAPF
jgi:hypothetical protein